MSASTFLGKPILLRGRVIFPSAKRLSASARAEAQRTYPSEIRITHFAVSVSPSPWRPVRTVIDQPAWLVPFGETWQGKACGNVVVEDPIPPEYLGAENLGNPTGCYGVELTISVGTRHATKRVIVKCGAVGGG